MRDPGNEVAMAPGHCTPRRCFFVVVDTCPLFQLSTTGECYRIKHTRRKTVFLHFCGNEERNHKSNSNNMNQEQIELPLISSSLIPMCLALFRLHFSIIKSISSSSSSSSISFSSIFNFSNRTSCKPGSFRRFREFFLLGLMILIGLPFNACSAARVRRLLRRHINTARTHNSNAAITPAAARLHIRTTSHVLSEGLSLLDSVKEKFQITNFDLDIFTAAILSRRAEFASPMRKKFFVCLRGIANVMTLH